MSLSIKPQEVSRKKVIGHLDGNDVYQIDLKGGLFIMARVKGAQLEVLASGPHPVVMKAVGAKLHPHLVITELLKSEALPESQYSRLMPFYTDLTGRLNTLAHE